eukprot:2805064-Pyramimonas_sp.AAC.1
MALDRPASPANSSRKTCFLLTELLRSARLSTRRSPARTSWSLRTVAELEGAAARGGTRSRGPPRRGGRAPRSAPEPCGARRAPEPPCRAA